MGFLSGSLILFALRGLSKEISQIREDKAIEVIDKIETQQISLPSFVSATSLETTFAKFSAVAQETQANAPTNAAWGRIAVLPPYLSFLAPKTTASGGKTKLPPIILLHGFDSSCLEFRRLAPLLATKRDVYVPDILGWGFSPSENVSNYSPEAKMAHLNCFIDQVIGDRCIVIGASLGGALAITLAAENPDKVEKVVLIDAQGFIDGKGPSDIPDILARLGINVLKSWPLRMLANFIAYSDKSFATWDAMTIGRLHCKVETWEDASVAFLKSGGFIVSDKVALVKQDTLVLWGRNDEILEPSTAERFQQTLPSSTLRYVSMSIENGEHLKAQRWVENCGHVPHLEKPDEAAEAILRFLGDLRD